MRPDGSPGYAYRIRNPVAVRTASAGRARHRTPHADEPASASSTEHMPHPRTPPQKSPMNPPSPDIAAYPPSRPRALARRPGPVLRRGRRRRLLLFPARHRLARALALILNGNTEAGAAKLAAYAFIAGGIQSFLMRLSPRLGFMALLCSTLTLLGVLVAWNLLPRIADGLPYAGAALGGWRWPASLMRAGVEAPIGPTWAARAPPPRWPSACWPCCWRSGCWCCARWFSESRTARRAGGPPTTRNTDPDEIRRCILALRGRLSRRPA